MPKASRGREWGGCPSGVRDGVLSAKEIKRISSGTVFFQFFDLNQKFHLFADY